MTQQNTRTKQERLTKINKDRRMLMVLLRKLKVQIEEVRSKIDWYDEGLDPNLDLLDELYKRRKDYRKRLTKLTNKRHAVRTEA